MAADSLQNELQRLRYSVDFEKQSRKVNADRLEWVVKRSEELRRQACSQARKSLGAARLEYFNLELGFGTCNFDAAALLRNADADYGYGGTPRPPSWREYTYEHEGLFSALFSALGAAVFPQGFCCCRRTSTLERAPVKEMTLFSCTAPAEQVKLSDPSKRNVTPSRRPVFNSRHTIGTPVQKKSLFQEASAVQPSRKFGPLRLNLVKVNPPPSEIQSSGTTTFPGSDAEPPRVVAMLPSLPQNAPSQPLLSNHQPPQRQGSAEWSVVVRRTSGDSATSSATSTPSLGSSRARYECTRSPLKAPLDLRVTSGGTPLSPVMSERVLIRTIDGGIRRL